MSMTKNIEKKTELNPELVQALNAICLEQPYTVSWYVKDLVTGAQADRGGHVAYPSGSTRKTAILMAVLRAVHGGRLSLDEPIVYEERLRENVMSGTFKYLTPGFTISLRDALVQMIVISDNVCTGMVLERITLSEINAFCQIVGMKDTVHRTNVPAPNMPVDHALDEVTVVSAYDQGLLYQAILEGTHNAEAAARIGCTMVLCAFAIEVLSWQKLRNKISAMLPFDAKVAHKGGTGKRGRMDGGIVYRDGQPLYIITVYTDQVPVTMPDGLPGFYSAFTTMARLSRTCWDVLGAQAGRAV